MNLLQEQFFTGEVGEVAGFDSATLQNVLKRGRIDLPRPGIGGRRLFNAETVLHLAFTKHLMDRGLGPHQATSLVTRQTTRYPSDTLREYLTDPKGTEIFLFNPSLKPDDKISAWGYEFVAGGVVDFSDYPKADSFLVLRVGVISKEVLTKLEAILVERKTS